MKRSNIVALSLVGLAIGCVVSSESVPAERIIGIYTLESSFFVPESKRPIGDILRAAKVRDTIYITAKQSGFEVTNKKWRLNNYDMEGWQKLRPGSTGGAMYTYHATFDPTDSSLVADLPGMMPTLYLDIPGEELYKGRDRTKGYTRISNEILTRDIELVNIR